MPSALREALRASSALSPAFLALGEVHDNPLQHRLRLRWLGELFAESGRFCLAMEQLDAARQMSIDAQRADAQRLGAPPDPRAVAEAGGFQFDGWEWPLYEPVIAFALLHDLPLIGANLANAETAAIARGQPHAMAQSRPGDWREADEARQRQEIADAHCGVLPASVPPAMARAQRARDATMAQAVSRAGVLHRLPVVLLAGNGHVRRDLGVPRYLADAGHRGRVLAVGFLERAADAINTGADGAAPVRTIERPAQVSTDPSGAYDWQVLTDARARSDPCVGLRERFNSRRGALLDGARPAGQ